MKAFASFFILIILFQSLFLVSLVKVEVPGVLINSWDATQLHKSIALDPFLLPGKEGVDQNIHNKNEWIPFSFNKNYILRNPSRLPVVSDTLIRHFRKNNIKFIPVFILNAILRI